MKYKDFDKRDTCLQVSHYFWATLVLDQLDFEPIKIFYEMLEDECRLLNLLGHRKNRTYRWSNSNGITKWLQTRILRYFNIDPYKGLNGDQYRALFLHLQFQSYTYSDQVRNNILFGFILRLGFFPSLMEHAILKPQSLVLFWKSFKGYKLNPLYWLSLLCFYFSMKRNLAQPIKGHTTNKISLLPTMYYLGFKLPPKEYTDKMYDVYYGKKSELGQLMKKAIDKLRNM